MPWCFHNSSGKGFDINEAANDKAQKAGSFAELIWHKLLLLKPMPPLLKFGG